MKILKKTLRRQKQTMYKALKIKANASKYISLVDNIKTLKTASLTRARE